MCCGWVFKQNVQGFQKMDKLSSTALKNKPLFKEWLVRIKKANLLKLGQYQICLEHFEMFRALDINPRKLSLGPDFSLLTNRLKERVLCDTWKSRLICLYVWTKIILTGYIATRHFSAIWTCNSRHNKIRNKWNKSPILWLCIIFLLPK